MTSRAELRNLPAAVLALVTLAAVGCERDEEPRVSPRSDVQVSLPSKPDLSPIRVEIHHADGTLTVAGVVEQRGELMGEDVTVRGDVVEIFTCPKAPEPAAMDGPDAGVEPDPADEPDAGAAPEVVEAPFCPKPPHLYLADGERGAHRLLVVGSERTQIGEAEVGDTLTVTGRMEMISPDGRFIRQGGLVILPEPPEPEPEPVPEGEGEDR